MRTPLTLFAVSICCLISGCTKEPAAVTTNATTAADSPATADAPIAEDATATKTDDCTNCPDAGMVPTATHDPAVLTKGITLTEFTPISEILAAPADFEGQRLLVKGIAVGVCQKRGCWVTLKSDADNSRVLRIKVEDGEIVFPLTVKGSEVVAEGILEKLVTPEETWREILRKQAESKGETFDPKSVTGPKITWQIKGLGARWES
ncbi:MAG: DUF4920 domain-containing protein [Planctomycetes bacterium]|nr:DUF4920 domain-containing protein [Planctomycetota bacterium]